MPPKAAPKSTPRASGPVTCATSPAGRPSETAERMSPTTVAGSALAATGTMSSSAAPSVDGIGPTGVVTPSIRPMAEA